MREARRIALLFSLLSISFQFGGVAAQTESETDADCPPLINATDAYTGIGQLRAYSSCTAWLFDTPGPGSAPAFALTAGHCVVLYGGRRYATEVLVGAAPGFRWRVIFNYFVDTVESQQSVDVAEISYATMSGDDLAVLRLNATKEDLRSRGLTFLPLAEEVPAENEEMRVVGIPFCPRVYPRYMRETAVCHRAGVSDVIEHSWYGFDRLSNNCTGIHGGHSGGPVLNKEGKAYGVLGTGALHATSDQCGLHMPCEVEKDSDGGTSLDTDRVYSSNVTALPACFDEATGTLELQREECYLRESASAEEGAARAVILSDVRSPTKSENVTWSVALDTSSVVEVRYKTGRAGLVDCRHDQGYSDPLPVSDLEAGQPLEALPVPEEEGSHVLCVLGGSGNSTHPEQPVSSPSMVIVRVDNTPPQKGPEITTAGRWVRLHYDPPEIARIRYATVAPDEGCPPANEENSNAYRPYWWRFRVTEPQRLCTLSADSADNWQLSPIATDLPGWSPQGIE
uniref:Peptidase S1 domain-containing protein n=1 Tax=Chromera velia CCMP2878 TaxID=1169474 RepID=A0A0G4ICQ1_9ALVE|eukprot:Cvel_13092.t1-p1 / transcript=Cvel_13092.t1 / gene=Cvel_13092 / organism=Chromera_velia_CCMP2878 / gene_product=hypothetical protein / transcript_product=hypothetical protein / location=Cvel_scaffold882:14773-16302(+) / protein_length=510 / sequence_SO=supercontig / SO=protein_coding / is_pseudo=false